MKVLMATKSQTFLAHVKGNLSPHNELIQAEDFYSSFNYVHLLKISTFICHFDENDTADTLKALDCVRTLDESIAILVFVLDNLMPSFWNSTSERSQHSYIFQKCNSQAIPYIGVIYHVC